MARAVPCTNSALWGTSFRNTAEWRHRGPVLSVACHLGTLPTVAQRPIVAQCKGAPESIFCSVTLLHIEFLNKSMDKPNNH